MKIPDLRLPVTEHRHPFDPRPLEYLDELVPESSVEAPVSMYAEESEAKDHKEELACK